MGKKKRKKRGGPGTGADAPRRPQQPGRSAADKAAAALEAADQGAAVRPGKGKRRVVEVSPSVTPAPPQESAPAEVEFLTSADSMTGHVVIKSRFGPEIQMLVFDAINERAKDRGDAQRMLAVVGAVLESKAKEIPHKDRAKKKQNLQRAGLGDGVRNAADDGLVRALVDELVSSGDSTSAAEAAPGSNAEGAVVVPLEVPTVPDETIEYKRFVYATSVVSKEVPEKVATVRAATPVAGLSDVDFSRHKSAWRPVLAAFGNVRNVIQAEAQAQAGSNEEALWISKLVRGALQKRWGEMDRSQRNKKEENLQAAGLADSGTRPDPAKVAELVRRFVPAAKQKAAAELRTRLAKASYAMLKRREERQKYTLRGAVDVGDPTVDEESTKRVLNSDGGPYLLVMGSSKAKAISPATTVEICRIVKNKVGYWNKYVPAHLAQRIVGVLVDQIREKVAQRDAEHKTTHAAKIGGPRLYSARERAVGLDEEHRVATVEQLVDQFLEDTQERVRRWNSEESAARELNRIFDQFFPRTDDYALLREVIEDIEAHAPRVDAEAIEQVAAAAEQEARLAADERAAAQEPVAEPLARDPQYALRPGAGFVPGPVTVEQLEAADLGAALETVGQDETVDISLDPDDTDDAVAPDLMATALTPVGPTTDTSVPSTPAVDRSGSRPAIDFARTPTPAPVEGIPASPEGRSVKDVAYELLHKMAGLSIIFSPPPGTRPWVHAMRENTAFAAAADAFREIAFRQYVAAADVTQEHWNHTRRAIRAFVRAIEPALMQSTAACGIDLAEAKRELNYEVRLQQINALVGELGRAITARDIAPPADSVPAGDDVELEEDVPATVAADAHRGEGTHPAVVEEVASEDLPPAQPTLEVLRGLSPADLAAAGMPTTKELEPILTAEELASLRAAVDAEFVAATDPVEEPPPEPSSESAPSSPLSREHPPRFSTWAELAKAWKSERGQRYLRIEGQGVCRLLGPANLETLTPGSELQVVPINGGSPFAYSIDELMKFERDAVFHPEATRHDVEFHLTLDIVPLQRQFADALQHIAEGRAADANRVVTGAYASHRAYMEDTAISYYKDFFGPQIHALSESTGLALHAAERLGSITDMDAVRANIARDAQLQATVEELHVVEAALTQRMRQDVPTERAYQMLRRRLSDISGRLDIELQRVFPPASSSPAQQEAVIFVEAYRNALSSMLDGVGGIAAEGLEHDRLDQMTSVQFELTASLARYMRTYSREPMVTYEEAVTDAEGYMDADLLPLDLLEPLPSVDEEDEREGAEDRSEPEDPFATHEGYRFTDAGGRELVVEAETSLGLVRSRILGSDGALIGRRVDVVPDIRQFLIDEGFTRLS